MVKVTKLLVDYAENPLGLDNYSPKFSWAYEAERGERAEKYRLIIADNKNDIEKSIGNIFDSGIEPHIEMFRYYEDNKLKPQGEYFWQVILFAENGKELGKSETAVFEMAISENLITAEWIDSGDDSESSIFKRDFILTKEIKKARLYIVGLGYYIPTINGQKIDDELLKPAWSDFSERNFKDLIYPYTDNSIKSVLYQTNDVTNFLKIGDNTMEVTLGNGWYNQHERCIEGKMVYGLPCLLSQLEVTYTDNTKEIIATNDSDWLVAKSPVVFNNIYFGEIYDAQLEKIHEWKPTKKASNPPSGKLRSQLVPNEKVQEIIKPIKIKEIEKGKYLYDFGINFAGLFDLEVTGESGAKIEIIFSEELTEDGNLDFRSTGGEEQIQRNSYILAGNDIETYRPHFTWYCFRYADVTIVGEATIVQLNGLRVNTDMKVTGHFSCSDDTITKLQEIYIPTQQANSHGSIPSDCPHRERLGYTGDGQITAETVMLNFDAALFYRKWFEDICMAQNKDSGFVPHTVPFYGGGGGPAWGSCIVILAWHMYQYYGDIQALDHSYENLVKWIDYLTTRTDERGIIVKEEPGSWCLGDWIVPGQVHITLDIPPELVNTAYYAYCAHLMSDIALVLGLESDSEKYLKLAEKIAINLNKAFYNEKSGIYSVNKNSPAALAYIAGSLTEQNSTKVVRQVLKSIKERDYHIDSGIFATQYLFELLAETGNLDIALKMLSVKSYPSFGYMLEKGATTLWENWEYQEGTHCHPMFGSYSGFFYRYLAGIQIDPDLPGFAFFTISPAIDKLDWLRAEINTMSGKVGVSWVTQDNKKELTVIVPAHSYATLILPLVDKITEKNTVILNHETIAQTTGIIAITATEENIFIELSGGTFNFKIYDLAK